MQEFTKLIYINKDILAIIMPLLFSGFIILFSLENIDFSNFKSLKNYEKRYISLFYTIGFFVNSYLILNKYTFLLEYFILSIPIFLALSILSGINILYSADIYTKRIGLLEVIFLKTFEWIFISKIYIAYFAILSHYYIFSYFELNSILSVFLYTAYVFTFLVYTYAKNAKDNFGTKGFDYTKNTLEEAIHIFNQKFQKENIEVKNEIIDMMAFLVLIEDQDFFERPGYSFDIFTLLKRKLSIKKLTLHKIIRLVKHKNIFKIISTNKNKDFRLPKSLKILKRGHSTISQQLIRNTSMNEYSYIYTLRRKLYVEFIYTPQFFKMYERFKARTIRRNNNLKYYDTYILKVDILKAYWVIILKMPLHFNEFFDQLSKQSGAPIYKYYKLLNNKEVLGTINYNSIFQHINKISIDPKSLK